MPAMPVSYQESNVSFRSISFFIIKLSSMKVHWISFNRSIVAVKFIINVLFTRPKMLEIQKQPVNDSSTNEPNK